MLETANRKTEELDAAREGIIRAHANIQFNENTKYYSQQFFRFPTPLWSKNGLLSAASFVFRNHRAEFATLYLLLCGCTLYIVKKMPRNYSDHLSPPR